MAQASLWLRDTPSRPRPREYGPRTLTGIFGDRRLPPEIKFGIEEVVAVSIFEGAASGVFIPAEASVRRGNNIWAWPGDTILFIRRAADQSRVRRHRARGQLEFSAGGQSSFFRLTIAEAVAARLAFTLSTALSYARFSARRKSLTERSLLIGIGIHPRILSDVRFRSKEGLKPLANTIRHRNQGK